MNILFIFFKKIFFGKLCNFCKFIFAFNFIRNSKAIIKEEKFTKSYIDPLIIYNCKDVKFIEDDDPIMF
jgi:hypothetical protein